MITVIDISDDETWDRAWNNLIDLVIEEGRRLAREEEMKARAMKVVKERMERERLDELLEIDQEIADYDGLLTIDEITDSR